MNALFKKSYLLLVIVASLIVGCAKDNPEPEDEPTTVTPVNKGKFTYSVNGQATITADSAVYYPKFTTIYSYKAGLENTLEINLEDLVVGTYTVNSVEGNGLTYVSSGQTYTASSGIVNITNNTGSRLSGDFNGKFSGGAVSTISGQFTEIRYR